MIQYTSGTTGFPKGALLHHRGLANNGADTAVRMGVEPGDVYVTTMPLFHTGGCVCCVLGAVSRAATQVLVEAFEPGLVLELFATYRGNAMLGVPTMLVGDAGAPCLRHARICRRSRRSVPAARPCRPRWCGGSKQSSARRSRIVFGQTECSPVAAMTKTTDTHRGQGGHASACRCRNMEMKIVDPDTGETVPIGEIGEFCTRGYHVMHGYFENAGRHRRCDRRRRLAAHRRPRARWTRAATAPIEGRLKDMIIRGGENIYPRELEELLFRHPNGRRGRGGRTAATRNGARKSPPSSARRQVP